GAATRAALDGRRGLLYAAVTPAGPRGFGDRPAPGDIKVYDVEKVLHGKGQPGSELRSVGVAPANAVVSHLFLSPDGKWLYYLDVKDSTNVRVGRVDTASLKRDRELRLADKTDGLCLTPDGKTLYATVSLSGHQYYSPNPRDEGKIQVIDP